MPGDADLLDELCHAEHGPFLSAGLPNEALNICCEYSNAESIPCVHDRLVRHQRLVASWLILSVIL